jgi:hypothetical protein
MVTKKILTFAVLGAVGYWIYTRTKAKKSLNPFTKSFTGDEQTFMDEAYNNASGRGTKGCYIVKGNVSVPIPFVLGNGDVVVKTGGGTTVESVSH